VSIIQEAGLTTPMVKAAMAHDQRADLGGIEFQESHFAVDRVRPKPDSACRRLIQINASTRSNTASITTRDPVFGRL
jgi:hypothetical protein